VENETIAKWFPLIKMEIIVLIIVHFVGILYHLVKKKKFKFIKKLKFFFFHLSAVIFF
jgi:hypothetical protein